MGVKPALQEGGLRCRPVTKSSQHTRGESSPVPHANDVQSGSGATAAMAMLKSVRQLASTLVVAAQD